MLLWSLISCKQMPKCILFACYKKWRVTPIWSLWLALMQEKAASAIQVLEYHCVQWSAASVPGIQGRHFGAAWQYRDTRVWWDTDLPFPSSTVMPLTVEWWMVAPTSHIFAHARTWHTFRLAHVQKHGGNPPVGSTRLWHCITHTVSHKTDWHPYCSAALFRARCRRKGE